MQDMEPKGRDPRAAAGSAPTGRSLGFAAVLMAVLAVLSAMGTALGMPYARTLAALCFGVVSLDVVRACSHAERIDAPGFTYLDEASWFAVSGLALFALSRL